MLNIQLFLSQKRFFPVVEHFCGCLSFQESCASFVPWLPMFSVLNIYKCEHCQTTIIWAQTKLESSCSLSRAKKCWFCWGEARWRGKERSPQLLVAVKVFSYRNTFPLVNGCFKPSNNHEQVRFTSSVSHSGPTLGTVCFQAVFFSLTGTDLASS